MDLLAIEPHVVSRDLRGYSVLFYGDPKSGKTTTASKFPKSLILGFEKGWNAIPGAMAIPMNNWNDMLKALRQLKTDEVKAKFETIIIDTADIAYDYCETYICQSKTVSNIGDIAYGAGYGMVNKEYDSAFRAIVQMGYGLVLISHAQDKKFTDEVGREYNRIVPTLGNAPRKICERLCDIIGYSRAVDTADGTKTMLFMRGTTRFVAGSRFTYTPDHIEFNYQNLVNAIVDAIDKQAAEGDGAYVTDEKSNLYADTSAKLDFDMLMTDCNSIIQDYIKSDAAYYAPRITEIVEKHLGTGKKVSECTRSQVQIVDIIVYELKEIRKND